jgi:hypothetical protein
MRLDSSKEFALLNKNSNFAVNDESAIPKFTNIDKIKFSNNKLMLNNSFPKDLKSEGIKSFILLKNI